MEKSKLLTAFAVLAMALAVLVAAPVADVDAAEDVAPILSVQYTDTNPIPKDVFKDGDGSAYGYDFNGQHFKIRGDESDPVGTITLDAFITPGEGGAQDTVEETIYTVTGVTQMTVVSGSTLVISDKVTLSIDKSAKFLVEEGAEIVIEEGGKLIIGAGEVDANSAFSGVFVEGMITAEAGSTITGTQDNDANVITMGGESNITITSATDKVSNLYMATIEMAYGSVLDIDVNILDGTKNNVIISTPMDVNKAIAGTSVTLSGTGNAITDATKLVDLVFTVIEQDIAYTTGENTDGNLYLKEEVDSGDDVYTIVDPKAWNLSFTGDLNGTVTATTATEPLVGGSYYELTPAAEVGGHPTEAAYNTALDGQVVVGLLNIVDGGLTIGTDGAVTDGKITVTKGTVTISNEAKFIVDNAIEFKPIEGDGEETAILEITGTMVLEEGADVTAVIGSIKQDADTAAGTLEVNAGKLTITEMLKIADGGTILDISDEGTSSGLSLKEMKGAYYIQPVDDAGNTLVVSNLSTILGSGYITGAKQASPVGFTVMGLEGSADDLYTGSFVIEENVQIPAHVTMTVVNGVIINAGFTVEAILNSVIDVTGGKLIVKGTLEYTNREETLTTTDYVSETYLPGDGTTIPGTQEKQYKHVFTTLKDALEGDNKTVKLMGPVTVDDYLEIPYGYVVIVNEDMGITVSAGAVLDVYGTIVEETDEGLATGEASGDDPEAAGYKAAGKINVYNVILLNAADENLNVVGVVVTFSAKTTVNVQENPTDYKNIEGTEFLLSIEEFASVSGSDIATAKTVGAIDAAGVTLKSNVTKESYPELKIAGPLSGTMTIAGYKLTVAENGLVNATINSGESVIALTNIGSGFSITNEQYGDSQNIRANATVISGTPAEYDDGDETTLVDPSQVTITGEVTLSAFVGTNLTAFDVNEGSVLKYTKTTNELNIATIDGTLMVEDAIGTAKLTIADLTLGPEGKVTKEAGLGKTDVVEVTKQAIIYGDVQTGSVKYTDLACLSYYDENKDLYCEVYVLAAEQLTVGAIMGPDGSAVKWMDNDDDVSAEDVYELVTGSKVIKVYAFVQEYIYVYFILNGDSLQIDGVAPMAVPISDDMNYDVPEALTIGDYEGIVWGDVKDLNANGDKFYTATTGETGPATEQVYYTYWILDGTIVDSKVQAKKGVPEASDDARFADITAEADATGNCFYIKVTETGPSGSDYPEAQDTELVLKQIDNKVMIVIVGTDGVVKVPGNVTYSFSYSVQNTLPTGKVYYTTTSTAPAEVTFDVASGSAIAYVDIDDEKYYAVSATLGSETVEIFI